MEHIVQPILQLRVLVSVLDVMRGCCFYWQAFIVQPAEPPAVLTQVLVPFEHLIPPCSVLSSLVVLVAWHFYAPCCYRPPHLSCLSTHCLFPSRAEATREPHAITLY